MENKNESVKKEDRDTMLDRSYRTAYHFADKVFKKFPGMIKSVVLFGSVSKAMPKPGSDIDIMIIFDDTSLSVSPTFIRWYNSEVTVIINEIDSRLHVNTVTLTTFWENIKDGEPVAINVLRYGISLIDTGYFEPLKMLLKNGRIRPTEEAIYNALSRVPSHRMRALGRVLGAVTDLYWVAIDSAHAALMKHGKVPPSPEFVESLLKETFVDKKMLNSKYLGYYHELWKAAKAVAHGEINEVSGSELERYMKMADEFSETMKGLVEKKKQA